MIWAFVLKHWDKVVAVLLVAAVLGYVYVRGRGDERKVWKPKYDLLQTTLKTERESHALAMEQAQKEAASNLALAEDVRSRAIAHLSERIAHHSDHADSLVKRLRDAEVSRLRALAPAANAPTECRDYESDPTRLSRENREFLIGENAAAERNADLLEACREDYRAARLAAGNPYLPNQVEKSGDGSPDVRR